VIYFISISDICDASAGLENVFNTGVCGALSSDNRRNLTKEVGLSYTFK
jgi:hypothetical protein